MSISMLIQAVVSGLLMGGIYSLVAMGLSLIFGVMGIINFAHGALMMLAMYFTYWLVTLLGFNPYATLIITIPALFLIGALIQRFLIHKILDANESIQILLTLGICLFIENFALAIWSPDFRSIKAANYNLNIYLYGIVINMPKFAGFLFALVSVVMLKLFLRKTDLGLAISASSQNRDGSLLVGINVRKIFVIAFGMGVACVGAAGTFVVPFLYVYPEVGYLFVLNAFIVVVMGGMGNVMGAFYCSLIVGLTEAIGGLLLSGDLKHGVVFLIFILVLLFRPQGLLARRQEAL
jgi:branched-chain amino acid transport system permease protein